MAEVPELSDLPMDISDNDEEFYANDIPTKMKTNQFSHCHEKWALCLSKMKLQIKKPEKHVHVFKKAITLATVVENLKERLRFNNQRLFHDEDLLTQELVDERTAFTNVDIEEGLQTKFTYVRTSKHTIKDSKGKSLKMEGDNSIVALLLQGENINLELKINMDTYLEQNPNFEKLPIALGIVGHNLYLCCTEVQETRNKELCLTQGDDIRSKKDDELLPYIFFRVKSNGEKSYTFESAAFPGYYLSTSDEDNKNLQISSDIQKFLIVFSMSDKETS